MKRTLLYVSLLLLTGSAVFYGCKKESTDDPTVITPTADSDTQTAQDNSLAEGTFNDVNNIAGEAVQNNSVTSYRMKVVQSDLLSTCATVNFVSPGNITVDFGSAPCLCNDLRYRKGVINIGYTGLYRDSATVITVTFNNFYVGRDTAHLYKVTGTKTVTNKGHNASGNLWFNIQVNGSLQNVSGHTMTWNSTRTREWIAGESTVLDWTDDEYKISGSITGTNFLGNGFVINVTQPLHIALNCRWIEDGKFEYTPAGKLTRHVDYGGGLCDNQATVTIGGYTFAITLY